MRCRPLSKTVRFNVLKVPSLTLYFEAARVRNDPKSGLARPSHKANLYFLKLFVKVLDFEAVMECVNFVELKKIQMLQHEYFVFKISDDTAGNEPSRIWKNLAIFARFTRIKLIELKLMESRLRRTRSSGRPGSSSALS